MTKLRAPASFEHAITRIAGLIGWEECARLTARTDRTVRDWSDPDSPHLPTIEQACALDAAYRANGGGDAPLYQVYAMRLDLAEARPVDADAIRRHTVIAAKENGEAISALIAASAPDASEAQRARALLEVQEAMTALISVGAALGVPSGTLAPPPPKR